MKWLCVTLLISASVFASAQKEEDYFGDDYDGYDFLNEQLQDEENKIESEIDNLQNDDDLKIKEEIEKFINENQDYDANEDTDYQVEDNRDKPKDYEDQKDIPADSDSSFEADDNDFADKDMSEKEIAKDYALLWGDDNVAPLPVPDSAELAVQDKEFIRTLDKPKDEIIDETKKILEETDDSFNSDADNPHVELDDERAIDEQNKAIVAETKRILEETDDSFNNNAALDNAEKQPTVHDVINDNELNEKNEMVDKSVNDKVEKAADINQDEVAEKDSVDKAYADLNADLDKLLDTLDKLSDSGDNDPEIEGLINKIGENFQNEDEMQFEKSDEDKDDYAEIEDVDFDKILEDILNEDNNKDEKQVMDKQMNDEMLEVNPDDTIDKDSEDLLKSEVSSNDMEENGFENQNMDNQINDEMFKANPEDTVEKDAEELPKLNDEPILLDAIIDNEKVESIEDDDEIIDEIDASIEQSEDVKSVDINSLNSEELEDLVKQFEIANKEEIDIHADTFDEGVAPIHITLNVDTPIVVTSPNYPSPYPTNNVVDWIFDGEGMGIELNITDFAVNGALGDFLLVKPGGVDEVGHDGLVFTYRLNSEKRFRFTDVDRLFVRFKANLGMMWMRGFQFSVKMISPLPEEPAPLPEPEPVLETPHSFFTVHLAAVSNFAEVKEQLRQLLADMAQQYIEDNDISPGKNTTSEVTQITSVAACPVTWPEYESCIAVTFGIPLTYNEDESEKEQRLSTDELEDMWRTLSHVDPWALGLSKMGVIEFHPPQSSILTAWLVIASGVVISMAMLAFVLWRFSCFEDYTRMKNVSDTDSLYREKPGLDLYPTPHQTLPPLYAENEYKWPENDDSTRVDMGGFANKNYARDMYDFESDEDVTQPAHRTGAVSARDIYNGSNA